MSDSEVRRKQRGTDDVLHSCRRERRLRLRPCAPIRVYKRVIRSDNPIIWIRPISPVVKFLKSESDPL